VFEFLEMRIRNCHLSSAIFLAAERGLVADAKGTRGVSGVINPSICRHETVRHWSALSTCCRSLFWFRSPYGVRGLFTVFVVVGLATALASRHGVPAQPAAIATESAGILWATSIGRVALECAFIGQSTIWTYIIAIGSAAGSTGSHMSLLLAFLLCSVRLGQGCW